MAFLIVGASNEPASAPRKGLRRREFVAASRFFDRKPWKPSPHDEQVRGHLGDAPSHGGVDRFLSATLPRRRDWRPIRGVGPGGAPRRALATAVITSANVE
jgi:hypothetical protein